jgi:hypothetical protein
MIIMSDASWFLFTPGADSSSFIVNAMAGPVSIKSLSSSSKQELLSFLSDHSQAKTFLVSSNSGEITDPTADSIEIASGSATKYQFRRETNGLPAVLGVSADGKSVGILRSKLVTSLVSFLNKHSGASTCAVAVAGSDIPKPSIAANPVTKPNIEFIAGCTNFNSRNGTPISSVVVHFTTTDNIDSPIGHFLNPESQVSAHYIVGKDGRIVQMVRDENRAWHCGPGNSASIGIEHVAEFGDKLTPAQEKASAALIKFLLHKHGLTKSNVTGHQWVPGNNTNCPGTLWPDISDLEKWVKNKIA